MSLESSGTGTMKQINKNAFICERLSVQLIHKPTQVIYM